MYVGMGTEPARIIRIVAFFVAGLVLAVGGALIYSTAHSMGPPVEIVRVKAPAQTQASAQPRQNTSAEEARAAQADVLLSGSGAPRMAAQDGGETDADSSESAETPKTKSPVEKPAVGRDLPPVLVPAPLPATIDTQPVNSETRVASASVTSNLPSPSPVPAPETAPREIHAAALFRQPHVATLFPGTNLVVRLGETLSSEHNSSGDTFRGTLEFSVVQNGFIIAEKGSAVRGKLLYAHQSRFPGGGSELSLTVIGINTTDGQFVPVRTSPWEEKNGQGGLGHTAKHAVGTIAGVMMETVSDMGKVVRLGFGSHDDADKANSSDRKNLLLPRGSTLNFRLSAPVTLVERMKSTE